MMADLMVESAARCVAEGDSQAIAGVIASAVACVYSPTSTPENRRAANKIIEDFKEVSEICAEVGFWLSRPDNSVEIRHFGLQAVEHVIKYRWVDITPEKRCMIKYNCTELINSALNAEDARNSLVKEAVAKCLVEMAKREWPQNWPEFLTDCEFMMAKGHLQNEVIIVTLLRLVQDVVTMSTMEKGALITRRKELNSALVLCMPQILRISLSTLKSCSVGARGAHGTVENHLYQVTLELLAEILEWAPSKDIAEVQSELYPLICKFLSYERHKLHMYSASCLWQIASRKTGKMDEMIPFMGLFGNEPMNAILNASQSTATGSFDEGHYVFLKTLAAILGAMGQTLFLVWGIQSHSTFLKEPPENFDVYMNALLGFLEHSSLCLRNLVAAVLVNFVHSDVICGTEQLKRAIPILADIIPIIWLKKGSPSMSDCMTCEYSKVDYESDAEFLVEHRQFSERMSRILTQTVVINWRLGYEVCNRWFNGCFVNDTEMLSIRAEDWHSMVKYFRNYFEQLSKVDLHFKSMVVQDRGGSLINGVIRVISERKAPWSTVDQQLSLLSTLFVFLPTHSDKLAKILELLFNLLEMDATGDNDALKAVQFHALNILINLATDYFNLMLPLADTVFTKSEVVVRKLSVMFQAKILVVLCALSNKFEDAGKQKEFVLTAIRSSLAYWASPEVNNAVSKPENFMKFIGLCDEAVKTDEEAANSPFVKNRMNLLDHMGILEAVMMRIDKPRKNTGDESKLGYPALNTERHPIFEELTEIMPAIFLVARCLNGIYSESCLSKIHSSFGGVTAIDLSKTEKYMVYSSAKRLSFQSAQGAFKKVTSADHMRAWVSNMTDKTHMVISLIVTKCSWQYFELESASQFLRFGLMGFVEDCLDLRLRHMIKKVWKTIANHLAHQRWQEKWLDVLYPSISLLIQHTYQRISLRWESINKAYESEDESGCALSKQEAFLEDMTCCLAREFVDFLIRICATSERSKKSLESEALGIDGTMEEEQPDQEEGGDEVKMEDDGDQNKSVTDNRVGTKRNYKRPPPTLSPMGIKLMQNESDRAAIVLTVFHCVMWRDTRLVPKLQSFSHAFTTYLLKKNLLDEESASHIFRCIIQGFKIHGEDVFAASALVIFAIDLYEQVRPSFPILKEILKELPETSDEEVTTFDEKVVGKLVQQNGGAQNGSPGTTPGPTRKSVKGKRMMMKKILKGAIGINVGQQFKKNVQMRNLPPFLKPERKKPEFEDDFNLDILEMFSKPKAD